MRVLFSTIKDIGHITPLLVYAQYLRDIGHDVRVSAQAAAATILQKAGLAHALVDDPLPEDMREIMGKVDTLKGDVAIAVGFREGFAGVVARSASSRPLCLLCGETRDLAVADPGRATTSPCIFRDRRP